MGHLSWPQKNKKNNNNHDREVNFFPNVFQLLYNDLIALHDSFCVGDHPGLMVIPV